MNEPSPHFLVHGTDLPVVPPVRLRAGPLRLDYDHGDLRRVTLGSRELIRRIHGAVRDARWGTVPGAVVDESIECGVDSFRIRYRREHREGDIDFAWNAEITGASDGTIRFVFDGVARSTFLANRVGLCVLHPIRECAGARAKGFALDGSVRSLSFPDLVSREQPIVGFEGLAGLAHEVISGVWAELRFEGGTFETEDQRNWIDASFKTYAPSLRLPFPVEMQKGTRVRQEVILRIVDDSGAIVIPARGDDRSDPATVPVRIVVPEGPWAAIPALGLGCTGDLSPENFPDKGFMQALGLSHLRADVRLAGGEWGHRLLCNSLEAAVLGLPVELVVHVPESGAEGLAELRDWMASAPGRPAPIRATRILVVSDGAKSTTTSALVAVRESLGDLGVPIGAGTDGDLYEFHLQPPATGADFLAWTMNPQVHATDTDSLMETPSGAAAQVGAMRARHPGARLAVTSISLRPRTAPCPSESAPSSASPGVDPRQTSLACAAWTVAMMAKLTPAGPESLTWFETSGWLGVMEAASDDIPSRPARVFPVWHVFAAMKDFRRIAACVDDADGRVSAFAMSDDMGRRRIVLANTTHAPVSVDLSGISAGTIRVLDGDTVASAIREPADWWNGPAAPCEGILTLSAHAIGIIDTMARGRDGGISKRTGIP